MSGGDATPPCSRSRRTSGSRWGPDPAGSKVIVAEPTGRFDAIGVDCIATNVGDVIGAGAEPIAVLDHLAGDGATGLRAH